MLSVTDISGHVSQCNLNSKFMHHCVISCSIHWDSDHHKTSQAHSTQPLYSVISPKPTWTKIYSMIWSLLWWLDWLTCSELQCHFAHCMQNVNCFSPHWRTCKVTAVLWSCLGWPQHLMELLLKRSDWFVHMTTDFLLSLNSVITSSMERAALPLFPQTTCVLHSWAELQMSMQYELSCTQMNLSFTF